MQRRLPVEASAEIETTFDPGPPRIDSGNRFVVLVGKSLSHEKAQRESWFASGQEDAVAGILGSRTESTLGCTFLGSSNLPVVAADRVLLAVVSGPGTLSLQPEFDTC